MASFAFFLSLSILLVSTDYKVFGNHPGTRCPCSEPCPAAHPATHPQGPQFPESCTCPGCALRQVEIGRLRLSWCENLSPGGRSPAGSAVLPVLGVPRDNMSSSKQAAWALPGLGPSPLLASLFSTFPASHRSSPFAELRHKPAYHFRKITLETLSHDCLFHLSVYPFPVF